MKEEGLLLQTAEHQKAVWALLPAQRREDYEQAVREQTGCRKNWLAWLYGALPLSDMVAAGTLGVLQEAVIHTASLFGQLDWMDQIPLPLLLGEVVHPRVNNEPLECSRGFFAAQLLPKVKGKTMTEAALLVNLWCAQEASYGASDERTASPLTVLRTATGRCGEESTFVVQALRSVGLPARQVYVPRWAHCDDNHAWVEVWCDGAWHYLGACEPEAVLDRGWFTQSAARAMLIHTRSFVKPAADVPVIGRCGMAWEINRLPHYAKSKNLTVRVTDDAGRAVAGAAVRFSLLNYSAFSPIACLETDTQGQTQLTCGIGSLFVETTKDGLSAQAAIAPEAVCKTLVLSSPKGAVDRESYDFIAPEALAVPKEEGAEWLQREGERLGLAAQQVRAKKVAGFYPRARAKAVLGQVKEGETLYRILQQARGNAEELLTFLSAPIETKETAEAVFRRKIQLLESLSPKDLYDVTAALLLAHLKGAGPCAAELEEEVFRDSVLCPRMGLEPLTDWRTEIAALLPAEETVAMKQSPERIWMYVNRQVTDYPELEYPTIQESPGDCLLAGVGGETAKRTLFVAICRTLGIPAKLQDADGVPLFYRDGQFIPVAQPAPQTALKLQGDGGCWHYGRNWTISRRCDKTGRYDPLVFRGETSMPALLPLVPGAYRLVTTNRLPSGNQLASVLQLALPAGDNPVVVTLPYRDAAPSELLAACPLPPMTLQDERGLAVSCGEGMFLWLEPEAEPTVHVFNELLENQAGYAPWASMVHIVLTASDRPVQDPLLARVMAAFPGCKVLWDPARQVGRRMARGMFLDPDLLPLVLAVKGEGTGIYGSSGYQVGAVEMLLKLWTLAQTNRDGEREEGQ